MKKLMKVQQVMIPKMKVKEELQDFENMHKHFLDPKILNVPIFVLLPQCIWSGFRYEKTDEGAADDDTKDEGSIGGF